MFPNLNVNAAGAVNNDSIPNTAGTAKPAEEEIEIGEEINGVTEDSNTDELIKDVVLTAAGGIQAVGFNELLDDGRFSLDKIKDAVKKNGQWLLFGIPEFLGKLGINKIAQDFGLIGNQE